MSFGFATVKKIMQSATDQPISDKAVIAMIQHIEASVIAKTRQAADYHKQKNNLRRMQGIAQKKRIDDEAVLASVTKPLNEGLKGGDIQHETKDNNMCQEDRKQPSWRSGAD